MCLGHFLAVVLHDYNVKRPGVHVLGRKCGTCMFTFRVFSQAFGFCGFLASFTSTLFSIFNVPRVPKAYFWFPFFPSPPFFSVVRTCNSFYSVPFVLSCLCCIRLREPILLKKKYFCLCIRSGIRVLFKTKYSARIL